MDRSFTLACSLSTKVSIVEFCLGENALEQNILTFVEHPHASYCNVSDFYDMKGAAFSPYLFSPLVCSNSFH